MKPVNPAVVVPIPTESWQAWIFDLDDTLLDTSGLLVPEAMRQACDFLVNQEASPHFQECLALWNQWRGKKAGVDLFEALATLAPPSERRHWGEQAYRIFRTPQIPKQLELRDQGLELLREARRHFPLFLVTQGDIATQMQKIKALNVASLFQHIYYIDPFIGENKLEAFSTLLKEQGFIADRVLAIGNRIDNEIAFGKRCGMRTCLVRFGEHKNEQAMNADQIPDYEITQLSELFPFLPQQETRR